MTSYRKCWKQLAEVFEKGEDKKNEPEPSTDSGDESSALSNSSPAPKSPTELAGESSDWWDLFSTKLTVKDDLTAKTKNSSSGDVQAFSVEDQVAIALRRLISGESLVKVGKSFGIQQHAKVSQVVLRFAESMEKCATNHLIWPNYVQMGRIKSGFQALYGLQNCCGVIVSTRIEMRLPSTKTEKNHSMILQAVVDPFSRFRDVSISSPGDLNEAAVLEGSDLFTLCESGSRLSGETVKLSGKAEAAVREYIVGDEAYPLLPWLLTPYKGENLADHQLELNNGLGAAIAVAKEALSSLKERFQFLKGDLRPDSGGNLRRIIFVCFLIHNIIADLGDDGVSDQPAASEGGDVEHPMDGGMLRDKLAECFRRI